MYPPELVAPMKAELVNSGYEDVTTTEAVDQYLNGEGTTFVVINSVCGCAARNARPAAVHAVVNGKKPDNIYTVFAGVDGEATDLARSYMVPFPPSSPSMALFKDGELVHMIERHHIEGRPAEMIAENLMDAYNEHC